MRRRQLNQPQCFSSGPSQLPNEGPAKSTATKSLKNSARQPLAELATHGAGQVSSPGQAVPCQPARTPLTSNTVAPLSHRKMGEGTENVAFRSFSQRFAIFRQSLIGGTGAAAAPRRGTFFSAPSEGRDYEFRGRNSA